MLILSLYSRNVPGCTEWLYYLKDRVQRFNLFYVNTNNTTISRFGCQGFPEIVLFGGWGVELGRGYISGEAPSGEIKSGTFLGNILERVGNFGEGRPPPPKKKYVPRKPWCSPDSPKYISILYVQNPYELLAILISWFSLFYFFIQNELDTVFCTKEEGIQCIGERVVV